MINIKRKLFVSVIILISLFTVSFFLFSTYLDNKRIEIEEEDKEALAIKEEEPLDNSILITLFKGDTKESSKALGELKKEFQISEDLNQKELTEFLSSKGYALDGVYDKELVYKRSTENSIEPNIYYIGEADGCIAIYSSDEEGNLTITDPTNDIFREGKKFKDLTKNDQEMIKNNELKCKSKDEAEEKVSELIS
ncbi:hypothetical protein SAMN04487886_10169 [Clostridium sp. DSM 8431]|uniref:hypothetical protein n=1 Tax=Clostridium sp. DSM 8431 TaxID=1761781 RepID=UPI0008E9B865|nr:hypothetical protein [Clostridium sp. DSM 8431]SFU38264.1 hypothetical protein SAMN04487886_10169 [Clostridium sp. DSM 8431]